MRNRLRRPGHRGQSLVEFAIILPVFLLIVVGILDFGRVVWATSAVTNAAREAARYAIVHGGSPDNACPVGPPGPETVIPAASDDCPHPSPSKDSIREQAKHYAIAGGRPIVVTVCYGDECTGDTNTEETNVRGTPVTVGVSSSVSLTLMSVLGFGEMAIHSEHTMVVNH
ncbi:MAG TPA: TadE family protein [Candidatus Limnocylindria bacterium]|nr:TadE family protein [Candidatus Limnocylindria bacterium]